MSLHKLYYKLSEPTSFSSENKIKKVFKGKQNIQNWLNKQNVCDPHTKYLYHHNKLSYIIKFTLN